MPTTACNPEAPPQPMRTMLNVKVEITKLSPLSIPQVKKYAQSADLPKKPQRHRIRKLRRALARLRDLGRKIQPLELLWAQRDVGRGMGQQMRFLRHSIRLCTRHDGLRGSRSRRHICLKKAQFGEANHLEFSPSRAPVATSPPYVPMSILSGHKSFPSRPTHAAQATPPSHIIGSHNLGLTAPNLDISAVRRRMPIRCLS